MLEIRRSAERGRGQLDWLDSRYSFSFADYLDPQHMGFGALRVINEDWIAPHSGFGTHGHRDMEILSWLLEGELTHRDSQGHELRLEPGHVQLMHAGRGIVHSELNAHASKPLHMLQIWIEPAQAGGEPGYEDALVGPWDSGLTPLATRGGAEGGLALRQDASVHRLNLEAGAEFELAASPERQRWVQIARGSGQLDGQSFEQGDGFGSPAARVPQRLRAISPVEALVFDLARNH